MIYNEKTDSFHKIRKFWHFIIPRVNRKYKDRLFRFLFRNKRDLLELYNAVNGTSYDNDADLTITTLENAVYLSMKNDLSFAFAWTMNLYEHQSTFNPNMPVRGVSYFARIYENYMKENGLDVYGKSKIKLPLPQFVVFYNGSDTEPAEIELKLSDLFIQEIPDARPALECIARVININHKDNRKLLNECRRLREYVYFTQKVSYYLKKGYSLDNAVQYSMDDCIKAGIMADVLSKFRNEVFNMFLFEYDEELHLKSTYEEGRAEGERIGRKEGELIGHENERKILLIKLLESKGSLPTSAKNMILSEHNTDKLIQWFDTALTAQTIDEFLQKAEIAN